MASSAPNYAQALANLLSVLNTASVLRYTQAPAMFTSTDAFDDDTTAQDTEAVARASSGIRANLNAEWEALRELTRVKLLEVGKAIGLPTDSVDDDFWVGWRNYLDDTGIFTGGAVDSKVTARGLTRASEPTLTDFLILRLNVDELGQAMETGYAQRHTIEVVSGTGAGFRDVLIEGRRKGQDIFERLGSGESLQIRSIDDTNFQGSQILANPTLANSVADGADITALTGWELSATNVWKADTSTTAAYYRTLERSIKTTTNGAYIQQDFSTELGGREPMVVVVACYPTGMASGDGITVAWGSKSQAFTALTQGQFNYLVVDRDKDLYPLQFDTAGTGNRVKLTVARSSGTMHIAAVFGVTFVRLNGAYVAVVSKNTLPAQGYKGDFTDTFSLGGKANDLFAGMFGDETPEAYLNTTGTNTILAVT